MVLSRLPVSRRPLWAALACSVLLVTLLIATDQRPAAATVTSVRGEACAYYVKVGLFSGPQVLNGCNEGTDQNIDNTGPARPPAGGTNTPTAQNDPSYSPHARITGSGGSMAAVDDNGAAAQYGPAVIHGGIWPFDAATAPPSGPHNASTSGSAASGSVTSIAEINPHETPVAVDCYEGFSPPCTAPGGFGPFPVEGQAMHVECTADQSGATGSTTLSGATLALSTTAEGEPLVVESVPDNPPPNYTRHGVITNVGDVFTVVYNQQIVNADGSLTVIGTHMYLYGPTAVGEVVRGMVTCGTTPSAISPDDTVAPSCGTPVVEPMGPEDPTPKVPRQELVGTFDAGNGSPGTGLQSITNVRASNATVTIGRPTATESYLKHTPGMTGPLPVTAKRINEKLPMYWSFDATDASGNTSHCQGITAPTLSVADVVVPEGDSGPTTVNFIVSRAGDSSGVTTVKYKTAGGSATADTDYTAITTLPTLTFGPGDTALAVPVDLAGDQIPELDETFNLVLSAPSTGTVIGDASATGTILNDDGAAFLSVNDPSITEGNAGSANVTFTVTRSGNTAGAVSATYKTAGGNALADGDYTSITNGPTVNFAAGQTSKAVTVSVAGDVANEANETFNLVLTTPVGAVLADPSGTATILNDDGPAYLKVDDPVVTEGNSGTVNAAFTLTRYGNTTGISTAKYKTGTGTATAGTDYTTVALTDVTFGPTETTKTVNVSVTGDTAVEKNETFSLVLSAPIGVILSDASGNATIVTDDGTLTPAPTTFWSVDDPTVNEGSSGGTTSATFTITRTDASAAATISYATTGGNATPGTDYTAVPATPLSFTAGQASRTVTVNVAADTLYEVNETFNVVLSAATTGTVIADTAGTATIANDDGQAYLAIGNIVVAEGSEGGTNAVSFTVTRTGNTTGVSSAMYKTAGGSATADVDYTPLLSTTPLTFGPTETSKTLTVNLAAETLPEKAETFNLVLTTPAGALFADASATATVLNDDGAAFLSVSNESIVEGNSGTSNVTFTITRSGNIDGPSTISYKTTGGTALPGTDYNAVDLTTYTFAPGESTKTVAVGVKGDTAVEPNRTFNLAISVPVGASIADGAGTATIFNDDV